MAKREFTLNASSQLKSDRLAEFLSASVEDDVTTVPGIAAAGAIKLTAAGITTTHALIGKFLMLRKPGITVKVRYCGREPGGAWRVTGRHGAADDWSGEAVLALEKRGCAPFIHGESG